MADLTGIGKILALIGGILMVVGGLVSLLGSVLGALAGIFEPFNGVSVTGGFGVIGAIITIIIGVLLIFIYTGKLNLGEKLVLGIVVLVLGIVGGGLGGLLAIIGGILIIIDSFT